MDKFKRTEEKQEVINKKSFILGMWIGGIIAYIISSIVFLN